MKIEILQDVNEANEAKVLSTIKYTEGFYIINDQLWLKDKGNVVNFIWSGLQGYFSQNIYANDETPERGDTISEEFLLKVLAIAKEPALIKEI